MADRRGAIFPLFILAWIFLSPSPATVNRDFHTRPRLEDVADREQRSLDVLTNSTYVDHRFDDGHAHNYADLNLTGFEAEKGYAWNAWPKIRPTVLERSEWFMQRIQGNSEGPGPPLFQNVTGVVHGKWVRSELEKKIEPPHLNLTAHAVPNPFGGPPREQHFGRNITGKEGDVRLQFSEKAPVRESLGLAGVANITEMNVEMTLGDESVGDEHELLLRGVYFQDAGHAVLTTTSDKLAGIFALPHFTPTDWTFNLSRILLNETISRTIRRQRTHEVDSLNPWSTSGGGAEERFIEGPQCELIVWLQQLEPPSTRAYTSGVLALVERELRFPSGSFLPPVPEMRFSMTAFSPDCGYILESKGPPAFSPKDAQHLTGPKMQVVAGRARHHLLLFSVCLALQLALLMRQMREANTPSTRSRISFYTIAGMTMGDALATIIGGTLSMVFEGLSNNLMVVAYVAFVGTMLFGMQFLVNIWAVQAPEMRARERVEAEQEVRRREEGMARLREARDRRRAAAAETAAIEAPNATANGEVPSVDTTRDAPAQQATETAPPSDGTLPLPATAQRPPANNGADMNFFMPSDQAGLTSIRDPFQALTEDQQTVLIDALADSRVPSFGYQYARFFIVLILTTYLSISAANWPSIASKIYFTFIAFVYLGFWVPQIWRNIWRNCRRALDWEFVLGQAGLRLLPFFYFYAYDKNVLFVERDYVSLGILVAWQWIQIVLLASQEILGPRWFVADSWLPPAYDYHPILREDEEGSTLPLGLSTSDDTKTPGSPTAKRRESITSPTARRGSVPKPSFKDKDTDNGKRVFDCAICMQDLEVPVINARSGESGESGLTGGGATLLARRMYMVTPCRHIFHTGCLEGWMKYRLQCPICREGLPPL